MAQAFIVFFWGLLLSTCCNREVFLESFRPLWIELNWKLMAVEAVEGKKSKVVVVGGGIAGSLLAKTMQYDADVILIDPKEYFEIPWAKWRCMVQPSFAERAVIGHTEYLTQGRLIVSPAAKVTESHVYTADNRCIPYDYLVIATGHADSAPLTKAKRLQQFQNENQKIQSASSILVIGGGPNGVELAGEIAADFPEKKVTLVHGGPRLLEFLGSKASSKTLEWLTSKNVDVLLNQTVNLFDKYGDDVYRTSARETIIADCHFMCVGRPIGSSWLNATILDKSLDKRGRLMVDEHLRIKGWKNVFAVGDITHVPELKQGMFAQKQALVAANNIKQLIKGKDKKMETYKAGYLMAIVALGRKDAVAECPLATLIGPIPGKVKSKDLFVGRTRRNMGLDRKASS